MNEQFVYVSNWPIVEEVAGEFWSRFASKIRLFSTGDELFAGLIRFRGSTGRLLSEIKRIVVERVFEALPAALALNDYYEFNAGRYLFELKFPDDHGTWRGVEVPRLPVGVRAHGLLVVRALPTVVGNYPEEWETRVDLHLIVMLRRPAEYDNTPDRYSLQTYKYDEESPTMLTRIPLRGHEYTRPFFTADLQDLNMQFSETLQRLLGNGLSRFTRQLSPTPLLRGAMIAGNAVSLMIQIFYLRGAVRVGRARSGETAMEVIRRPTEVVDNRFYELQSAINWLPSLITALRAGDQATVSARMHRLAGIESTTVRRIILSLLRSDYGFEIEYESDSPDQYSNEEPSQTGARAVQSSAKPRARDKMSQLVWEQLRKMV